MFDIHHLKKGGGGGGGRERERERKRERERERERDRLTDRQTDGQIDRERERQTETERYVDRPKNALSPRVIKSGTIPIISCGCKDVSTISRLLRGLPAKCYMSCICANDFKKQSKLAYSYAINLNSRQLTLNFKKGVAQMCSTRRKLIISEMKLSKLRGFSAILYLLNSTNLSSKALFALCVCVCGGGESKRERVQIFE